MHYMLFIFHCGYVGNVYLVHGVVEGSVGSECSLGGGFQRESEKY